MRFFSKSSPNSASSYVSSQGLNVILATSKSGQQRCYTPGSIIQGRVHLHLTKPITSPCQLKVVFTCRQSIVSSLSTSTSSTNTFSSFSPSIPSGKTLLRRRSSSNSQEEEDNINSNGPSTIFQVEHVLLEDQVLPACRRQGVFHFSIKLPLCSFPPSIEAGDRTVAFSIHAVLTFEAHPGNAASRASVSSSPAPVMYLPLVPAAVPATTTTTKATSPVSTTTSTATTAITSSTPTHEITAQITLDSPTSTSASSTSSNQPTINASVKSKTGVCLGDSAAMVLKIANKSHIDLHSIHLALVRQISYAISPSTSSSHTTSPPSSPPLTGVRNGHHQQEQHVYTYTPPESTTLHSATIPVAKVSNAQSSWSQQLQFRLPTNVGLIPTINKSITPLFKIDYFILISIPIPQRHNSLVSRLASSTRKRSLLDLSVFSNNSNNHNSTASSTQSPSIYNLRREQPLQFSHQPIPAPSKAPTALQFAPIPINIGTFSPNACHRKFKWPIPNYLEVTDRPTFVRDRFEEEMIQHLSSLESLMMEDEDDVDINSLVQAARKSGSSGESDEDEEHERDQSRVPARFRSSTFASSSRVSTGSRTCSGLGTPPPSPPQVPTPMIDDVLSIHAMKSPSGLRKTARRSLSPSGSFGLGKDLLMEMHHSKVQQQQQQPQSPSRLGLGIHADGLQSN